MTALEDRVARDTRNGEAVQLAAREALRAGTVNLGANFVDGSSAADYGRSAYTREKTSSLQAIAAEPFHAAIELEWWPRGATNPKKALWYAHTRCTQNNAVTANDVPVLAWTHPGVQLALASPLDEEVAVDSETLRIEAVKPLARARFQNVLPTVRGLYEPGGRVPVLQADEPPARASAGLKSVKLDMTSAQVKAFIASGSGMLLVQGAPGSGKTTVALQRVRFLFDQADEMNLPEDVTFQPSKTRVFIANENLRAHTERLVTSELDLPARIVQLIPTYVTEYLGRVWQHKLNARLRQRHLTRAQSSTRSAALGLAQARELLALWTEAETHVRAWLASAGNAKWMQLAANEGPTVRSGALRLAAAIEQFASDNRRPGATPAESALRMDMMYRAVRVPYLRLRESMDAKPRDRWDDAFSKWLFEAFDPVAVLTAFLERPDQKAVARARIGQATRDRNELEVAWQDVYDELAGRTYGPEHQAWLAWLLRMWLPEAERSEDRFRGVPCALIELEDGHGRLTHIVVDEAQDLTAPEASLIASLLHPRGALTVACDFKQVVAPDRGLDAPDAFQIASPASGRQRLRVCPFATNLRQTRQIGEFVRAFHQAVFGQVAEFDAGSASAGPRPRVVIASAETWSDRIAQVYRVAKATGGGTIAALLVDRDDDFADRLVKRLAALDVPVTTDAKAHGEQLAVLVAAVEDIKGLEFETCIVLGLEQTFRSSLAHTKNRAYVAVSRPTRKLILLSQEFPDVLKQMDAALYER
jgi:hypothetical protein